MAADQRSRDRFRLIILCIILPTAAVIMTWLIYDQVHQTATPTTQPATASSSAPTMESPTMPEWTEEEVKFLSLANLPAGQERAGIDAAKAWCAAVREDGNVEAHGNVLEQYPISGYSGADLLTAGVIVYCPKYTDQIPKVGG